MPNQVKPGDNDPNAPHMKAVQLATDRRVQRAEMKRVLGRGRDPLPLLKGSDEQWEQLVRVTKLRDVLLAVPLIGDVMADEIMRTAGHAPHGNVKVGAISYEGRAYIADLVREVLGRDEQEVTLDG